MESVSEGDPAVRRRPKDRKAQIARASTDAFGSQGYHAVSMEDIAARVTPKATVVRFNTVNDAFLALRSGQVDTQIVDSLQDAAFLAKGDGAYRNLPGNWSYEEIAIGVPAGDPDWLRIVGTFVRQLIGSGEDARLFKKYFGFDMPPL